LRRQRRIRNSIPTGWYRCHRRNLFRDRLCQLLAGGWSRSACSRCSGRQGRPSIPRHCASISTRRAFVPPGVFYGAAWRCSRDQCCMCRKSLVKTRRVSRSNWRRRCALAGSLCRGDTELRSALTVGLDDNGCSAGGYRSTACAEYGRTVGCHVHGYG